MATHALTLQACGRSLLVSSLLLDSGRLWRSLATLVTSFTAKRGPLGEQKKPTVAAGGFFFARYLSIEYFDCPRMSHRGKVKELANWIPDREIGKSPGGIRPVRQWQVTDGGPRTADRRPHTVD